MAAKKVDDDDEPERPLLIEMLCEAVKGSCLSALETLKEFKRHSPQLVPTCIDDYQKAFEEAYIGYSNYAQDPHEIADILKLNEKLILSPKQDSRDDESSSDSSD